MSHAMQRTSFTPADIEALAPAMKIGILATVGKDGLPHMTLLSSLRASSPTRLTFGQFTEGFSKTNVRGNPRTGFLVMTLQKELWRGTAAFSHTEKGGPDYDAYNNEPLFRYNSYFGIHTVYYLDVMAHTGRESLPMRSIISASLATAAARAAGGAAVKCRALNQWTRRVMSAMGNPKFAAYIARDGYPRIIPILQAQAGSRDRILFSPLAYGDELEAVPAGTCLAAFGMTLKMEDVLVRGTYTGIRRIRGIRCGQLEVDWVYNSMPPAPGRIYPPASV
ncbi:MAG: pyridoxamine 5'-phosphate oxidase family protein [Spirochaetia bacterium]